jgi:hypothetical protein
MHMVAILLFGAIIRCISVNGFRCIRNSYLLSHFCDRVKPTLVSLRLIET